MRGITEKDLIEIKEISEYPEIIQAFIDDCKELNQWQPIETAPRNRLILIYNKEIGQVVGFINPEPLYRSSTHWQELPEDPK